MNPASVKAAANRADDLIRSLQPVSTPPATEGDTADLPADVSVGEGASTPIDAATDEPPVVVETPAAPLAAAEPDLEHRLRDTESALEKAESRWKTLDGMIRAQNQQIEYYQNLLANVQQPAQGEATAETAAGAAKTTFTQSDVDQFGEDWVEFVHRVAREIARAEVSALSTDMAGLKGTVQKNQKVVELTAQDHFERQLDELAPSWRTLDADAQFIEWLKGSRVSAAGFTQGVESLDHDAVAEVFNMYAQLHPPVSVSTAKVDKRQQQLEAQVSPGKARQTPTAARSTKEEKIWPLSEIKAVYTRQSSKGTRLPADEFSALERVIADAQKEGRVDYNS